MTKEIIELSIAQRLAIMAGDEALRSLRNGLSVRYKEDGSPVTDADVRINEMIAAVLRKRFPRDGIISEELEGLGGDRMWYVDPIDGTKGFVSGQDEFAIHIGLCEGVEPVLGVVYQPKTNLLYSAFRGDGAKRVNLRTSESLDLRLEENLEREPIGIISHKNEAGVSWREALMKRAGVEKVIRSGSEGLRAMKIASGDADVRVVDPCGTWDICAPHAILLEAGGFVSYVDGREVTYTGQRKMSGQIAYARNGDLLGRMLG